MIGVVLPRFPFPEVNRIMRVLKLTKHNPRKRGPGRPPKRNRGGRPLKQLPAHEIVRLASEGATADYIAEFLNTTKPLLYRRFRAELERGRALRDGTLQMRQFAVALAGSPPMLKWLGTQWLGQRDRIEQTGTSDPLIELIAEMRKESKRIGPPENSMLPPHAEESES